jgi:phage FluMu protein Com
MEVNFSGLKCDHCSYRDDSVAWEDYEKYIDSKCPKCNSNLLTLEDYIKCVKIVSTINKFNNITKWFNPFYYIRRFIVKDMSWLTFDATYTYKNKVNN